MAIESEPGGGTTVTISLPVDGPKQVEEPAAIVAMPVARRKEEDDGTLRKTA
jgi:cell cycle sensor histidine kinase DivJ